jgi:hypothetical protein
VANRAWYQVARSAAGTGAVERLGRYGLYAAGLAAAAGVVLAGGARVRVGAAAVAIVVLLVTLAVDRPAGAGGLASRLNVHAAVGGLAVAASVGMPKTGRNRARDIVVFTSVASATLASGFALAGWRVAQLEDLVRQRRDVAHVIAGVVILVAPVGLLLLRGRVGWRRWRWCAWAVVAMALAAVAWTGVLMVVDGSDRATPAWWLRGAVVQEAEMGRVP